MSRVSGPSPTAAEAFDIPIDVPPGNVAGTAEEHSILVEKANIDRETEAVGPVPGHKGQAVRPLAQCARSL